MSALTPKTPMVDIGAAIQKAYTHGVIDGAQKTFNEVLKKLSRTRHTTVAQGEVKELETSFAMGGEVNGFLMFNKDDRLTLKQQVYFLLAGCFVLSALFNVIWEYIT